MKRIFLTLILVIILINFSNLFGEETKDIFFRLPKYQKLSFEYKIDSLSLPISPNVKISTNIIQPNADYIFTIESFSLRIKDPIAQFSLAIKDSYTFSPIITPDVVLLSKNKKNYSKTAIEISGSNIVLWAYNRYLLKKCWAYISLRTISWNFRHGPAWDVDELYTNHLMHPYNGAIHYSIARANRFNFLESTVCTFLGSFMWEFILESVGTYNNPPSTNDLITNTLGGMTLGEVLFRTADLVIDESSGGFERVLRESLAFLINPAYGFRVFSGEAFKKGNPPEKHFYSLKFPFGAYVTSTDKPGFLIGANLEYKDYQKKDFSEINPYDWFSFDCRLGISDNGIRHREIFTTGIIAGKRIKNGLVGLFGVFDYIDTHTVDKIAGVGIGPGLVAVFVSDSNLFFKSSGVLSLILGGSSPSFEIEDYHFGKKTNEPYYLGPGLLGKVKLELGKKGIGSIHAGFSQYWVHSIFIDADEFVSILSLGLKCDLSNRSQISLGYDYYLRHGTLQERCFTGAKPVVRALYIYKF